MDHTDRGMTVYVKDGKEISPHAWIAYFDPMLAGTLSCQPMNMTADQMDLAAVTTTVEQPMPDEFYGPVQKDPDNPGHWIQTPHSPQEMQVRLHDYSAQIRSNMENGGMMLADGLHATPSTRDVRAMYTTGSHNSNKKELNLTTKIYAIVDGMPSSVPTFVKMSKKELDQIDIDLTEFADQCIVIEANTSDQIRAGTITTKEEIAAAYESLRQRSPRMAPRAI
jgi:hypothetical protein